MEISRVLIKDQDVQKEEPITLISPRNPTPIQTLFLSNLDQTVIFPVETVFFFRALPCEKTSLDILERMKKSVSEVLLVPYYFMAGRLKFNLHSNRLELVCNNAGVLFVGAKSRLRLKDLGNVSLPNRSFQLLVLRTEGFTELSETPLLTIQVTRFKCGGFSIGFVTNHSILDGISAAEMFQNLASICRGEGLKFNVLYNDRTCFRARNPLQFKFPQREDRKPIDISSLPSSFKLANQPLPTPPPSFQKFSHHHSCKLFSFTPEMLKTLKAKANIKCSSFEAIVAHVWKARTKAIFEDPSEISTVMFAVDIRTKVSPPLPHGFVGNAVISVSASAKVGDLDEKPFSFCVKKVKEAKESVTDEYVRSIIDWLEIYKGVTCTFDGNFFVSAWLNLPFHELDFGYGKPIYGGPVVNDMVEFVLLLSDDGSDGMGRKGGINVWLVLEKEEMAKFMVNVFEI